MVDGLPADSSVFTLAPLPASSALFAYRPNKFVGRWVTLLMDGKKKGHH
ncbi:MAG: hypothetical protein IKU98_08085 [Bacteroidaceae bacterium]|nr:hypothetical protein [Bacteroidaceae bacterium]